MKKKIFPIILLLAFLFQPGLHRLNSESEQAKKDQKTFQQEVVVTLKLVQVYVTDRKGNPVTDLEKSEFILFDNGKLKTITDFEKHLLIKQEKKVEDKIKLKPEKKVKEKIKETETPPARKIPSRMNRKFFILIDLYQNDVPGLKKSKTAALHFIDTQIQPTDELSVLSYSLDRGLILHEYLTTDHQKVQEAVKRVKGVPGKMAKRNREWEKMKVRLYAMEIKEFAKALRYISGFKNIIFFSAGISRNLLYDDDNDAPTGIMGMTKKDPGVHVTYEDMSKELAASNCPVFTINTKGARGYLDDLDKDYAGEIAEDRGKEIGKRGDHSLQMVSDISGGKYFADIEYYEKISEEIQNLTGNYYVLGYYIDEKWDSKYHEIKVKVKRKGCQVYAQGGYFNPKPFSEFSEFEKQLHLFDLVLSERPYFQEPLYFPSIALLCSNKNESNIVLLSEIPKQKIKEVIRQKTEVITLIFDKDNNIVESRRTEIHFSTIPENTIYHYIITALNPGEYECRVVLRNLETGDGAVASSSVEIPEELDSGLRLYPPLLLIPEKEAVYLRASKEQKKKPKREPLSIANMYPFLSNRHSPLVDTLEKGISKLFAIVHCSHRKIDKPKIELFAHLTQLPSGEKTRLLFSILKTEKEKETDVLLLEINLPEMLPGRYSLEMTAQEMASGSESRTVQIFNVR
jgi:VWFA-related protein